MLHRAAGLLAMLLGVAWQVAAGEAGQPRRIVSLNLCTDIVLLDLVAHERIAALSWLAADADVSPVVDRVRDLRLLRGQAEEVLALAPDLVLAGTRSTPATVDLLRRLGLRVELVPLAFDIDGVRGVIRRVAAVVGEKERGEAVVASFDARLAASTARDAARPRALAYQVGNLSSGPESLVDRLLAHTGFANHAAGLRLGRAGRISLEQIAASPPDLLILAQGVGTYRTVIADNLRHPALARIARTVPLVELAMPLWLCGAPPIAEAAGLLADARRRIGSGSLRP